MKGKRFLILLLSAGILVAGFFGMEWLVATGSEAKKRKPSPMRGTVEVIEVHPTDSGIIVEGMGTVIAARKVPLKAQVGGRIVEISDFLLEGQRVRKDALLARIDPADYELKQIQAESSLTLRQAELTMEMGQQQVAEREWDLLGKANGGTEAYSALALREPQLKQAQANTKSAEAQVEQAKIDLERTRITAPFNALVTVKSVETGSLASLNTDIATLVFTDSFHVRVAIPQNRIRVLEIPGAKARVFPDDQSEPVEGRAISLLGDLDPQGRMARVLIEIEDPLGIRQENANRPKLLLDSFVKVEIEGRPLPGAFVIPRSALRDDGVVWLADKDSRLELRPVKVAWKNRNTVVVTEGLKDGEQLITSSLSFAVGDMPVTIAGQEPPAGKPDEMGIPNGAGKGKGKGKSTGGK